MNESTQVEWEHAVSRYMSVMPEPVDLLQRDFIAGRALGGSMARIDPSEAAVIVAESLEADRLWSRLAGRDFPSGPREFEEKGGRRKSDFRTAVAFELMIRMADVARLIKDRGAERSWEELAVAMLEDVLRSQRASPMLSYGEIFLDVAEAASAAGGPAWPGAAGCRGRSGEGPGSAGKTSGRRKDGGGAEA